MTGRAAQAVALGAALGASVLALGCGGAAPIEPPARTLLEYAAAARAADAAKAHALLDEETRSEVDAPAFAAAMAESEEELRGQAAEIERLVAAGVGARAELPLADGETVVLVLEEGRWVIDGGVLDAPAMRTPLDTVRALHRALARRSLRGIARVLARQPRGELEAELTRILEGTADELDLAVQVQGNTARVRLTGGQQIHLVREAGEWRIVEID